MYSLVYAILFLFCCYVSQHDTCGEHVTDQLRNKQYVDRKTNSKHCLSAYHTHAGGLFPVMGRYGGPQDRLLITIPSHRPLRSIVRCTVTALINSGLHCHTGRPGMSAIVRWPLLFLQDTHNCSDAGSCVCTPLNKCYRRKQVLYVDHRWLNRSAGHAIQITADVFNHVGLSTTTKVKVRSHYPIFCYYSCLSGRCRFH